VTARFAIYRAHVAAHITCETYIAVRKERDVGAGNLTLQADRFFVLDSSWPRIDELLQHPFSPCEERRYNINAISRYRRRTSLVAHQFWRRLLSRNTVNEANQIRATLVLRWDRRGRTKDCFFLIFFLFTFYGYELTSACTFRDIIPDSKLFSHRRIPSSAYYILRR